MQPVTKATGIYDQPSTERLVRCPHCSKILNHHAPAGVSLSFGDNGNQIIDLFGQDNPPAAVVPAPPAEIVQSGDIFVPPQVIGAFEQVTTGQAKPDKHRSHVIQGMTPTVQPEVKGQRDNAGGLKVLDHPVIGGKVTICVCLYGAEHHALHRRCLNSICTTVPPSRMDLRVACNQVGLETTNYLNTLPITKIYPDHKNRLKYPAMRRMFFDEENPIDTNYVVWFDDDSYVMNENWLSILGQTIVNQKPRDRVGMYGHKMLHPLKHPQHKDPLFWFKSASWWRGKDVRNKQGRGIPNGDKIHFVVGGFWAISKQAILECDIPDRRLLLSGGDIVIGEQLWQGNFLMKQFNENKQHVKTSGAPPRGASPRSPRQKKMQFYA